MQNRIADWYRAERDDPTWFWYLSVVLPAVPTLLVLLHSLAQGLNGAFAEFFQAGSPFMYGSALLGAAAVDTIRWAKGLSRAAWNALTWSSVYMVFYVLFVYDAARADPKAQDAVRAAISFASGAVSVLLSVVHRALGRQGRQTGG